MRSLHKYGIYHNNIKRALFDNFLLQPGHEHYLQDYLVYCSCLREKSRINKVIRAFEFTLNGGYTYGQLFVINNNWYDFFKENAWVTGIPRNYDNRLGVERSVVDNVMRHYYSESNSDGLDGAITRSMTMAVQS